MKKTAICVLTVLLLLCTLPATARADAIVEPEDAFYRLHSQDCAYVRRGYVANGEKGYVTAYASPVSGRERWNVPNGENVTGQWQYTDAKGEKWLLVERYGDSSGWIRLSDCVLRLDSESFRTAFQDAFTQYDGSCADVLGGMESVVLWSYPCSGSSIERTTPPDWLYTPDDTVCWRDAEGRLWGNISYFYGWRDVWVCLSDPENEDIPADDTVASRAAQAEHIADTVWFPAADTVPEPKSGLGALAVGLVAAVAAVSGGLIWAFFGRKRKN